MHIWLVLWLLCSRAFSTIDGAGWPFAVKRRTSIDSDQRYDADLQTHHRSTARLEHSGVTAVVFHQVPWLATA